MNELLQKHGCANVFTIPEGLKELMSDITREVLRDQPQKIFDYIANYLSVLLITREHGILAVKILDDLCDCRPSVSEHLLQLGMDRGQAHILSQIIKEEIEGFEPVEGKEKVREMAILKKILTRVVLEEDMAAKVIQVARNAYRDYWYRKKMMERDLKVHPDEPWQIAAERTLELYKRTKPSYSELTRATQRIQAAYRGYHVRRNLLRHLKPKAKKTGPKVELLGPPIDVAGSREIDLGPVINLKFRDEDTTLMFDEVVGEKLGLQYHPMMTITHIDDPDDEEKIAKHVSHSGYQDERQEIPTPFVSRTGRDSSQEDVIHFEESITEQQKFHVMSMMAPAPLAHHSSIMNNMPPTPAPSVDVYTSGHKISFAEKPVKVFVEDPVEEDIPPETDDQEVPEDIPDERSAATAASVPSSANDTANSTDVEDLEDTAEEE